MLLKEIKKIDLTTLISRPKAVVVKLFVCNVTNDFKSMYCLVYNMSEKGKKIQLNI